VKGPLCALGDFPQAYNSHLALIDCALALVCEDTPES